MKKIFIVVIGVLFCLGSFGQKNFEGEIAYELKQNTKPDGRILLKVLFGINKIKMDISENENTGVLPSNLIFIDSSIEYTINNFDKTYRKRKLVNKYADTSYKKETILGYKTTTINPDFNNLNRFLGEKIQFQKVRAFISEDLNYTLPDSVASNAGFGLISNGKIVLKIIYELRNFEKENKEINELSATAISVKEFKINEEEFKIPSDYKQDDVDNVKTKVEVETPTIDEIKKVSPLPTPKNPPKTKTQKKSTNTKKKV